MTDAFPDDSRRTGPALEKTYQLLFWLMPTVGNFPRRYKFVLGDRIQAIAMDVLKWVLGTCNASGRRMV